MNRTTQILIALALLTLAGCTTPETKCQEYGAAPGTAAYTNCMATLAAGPDKSWGMLP